MTTTSLRTAVKARLVEVWTDVLPSVQVRYEWPGEKFALRECVYLGQAQHFGGGDRPSAETGPLSRKPSWDDFTISAWFCAAQIGQSCQGSEERVESFYNACKDATIDPTVAGPNLYGEGAYPAMPGLLWVWLRPGDLYSVATPDGWVSVFEAYVDARTRLT